MERNELYDCDVIMVVMETGGQVKKFCRRRFSNDSLSLSREVVNIRISIGKKSLHSVSKQN